MLKRTSVFLNAAELKELAKLGKKLDRPVAWLIRKAVSELLKREQGQ
jgi:hypothetical protein